MQESSIVLCVFTFQINSTMLDQLLKVLVSQGQQTVVQNQDIPNQYNQQVIGEAGNSIMNGLQGMLANGGLTQIMRLFAGNGGGQGQLAGITGMLSNPLVQQMIQSFTGKITQQYNLSPTAAQHVGASLIPQVLQSLTQQVNDPNDPSIDVNGIMQSLTGGQAGGFNFNDLASKIAGGVSGDVNGDGVVDMQDMIASVSGAAKNQQQAGGNPIMDMISQFMK
jgi:hypothetical protein